MPPGATRARLAHRGAARNRHPTAVVWGEREGVLKEDALEEYAEANIPIALLPGVGRSPALEATETTARIVLNFARSHL